MSRPPGDDGRAPRWLGIDMRWRQWLAHSLEHVALAGRPLTLVTVILLQIIVTMWAVSWSAAQVPTDVVSGRDENMSQAERVTGLGFVER